ncbi:MAG: CAP domain-containing protein [Ilumatobacter sp.]|jgi:uncharacterized protein YkwD|uniref:CAP domain-containing protein n=1 Tax=Ilumatobacter sp. TaxID=1967498 RepID=UPI00391CABB4
MPICGGAESTLVRLQREPTSRTPRWRALALPAGLGLVLSLVPLSLPSMISLTSASSTEIGQQGIVRIATSHEPADRIGHAQSVVELPPPPPTFSEQAVAILSLVNAERTQRGLQPLELDERLTEAADRHTSDQAAAGDIYHVAPNGTGPGERIAATGYPFSSWGENVAAGYRTAEAVMAGWMNSPGHCRNILNPGYTELGVGYLETATSYRIWWTQKFARPQGVPAPPGVYNPAWC